MNLFCRAMIGAAVSMSLVYLTIAFVNADAWWVRDIWLWSVNDRISFLFGCMFAAAPGLVVGGAP